MLVVLSGTVLMLLGLAVFSIDFVSAGGIDFIDRHYEVFGLAIVCGVVCLLIGLVGWATLLDRMGRRRLATYALMLPLIIVVLAALSFGINVHGVFPVFVLSLAPIFVMGMVVAIMGAHARR